MKLTRFFLLICLSLSACATPPAAPTLPVVTVVHPMLVTGPAATPADTPVVTQAPTLTPAQVWVSVDAVTAVRSGPSTNNAVIGELEVGKQYLVLAQANGWWQIEWNGGTAWVFGGLTTTQGPVEQVAELNPAPTTPPQPTPASQAQAVAAIRTLMGKPDLVLNFVDQTNMINSPHGDLPVWQYADPQGRTYLVDTATVRVVEVDPLSGHVPPVPGKYSPDELQAQAEALAQAAIPNFAEIKDGLRYESSTKNNIVYYFRWQDDASPNFGINRPFLQVGLSVTGELASYYDTLYLR